MAHNGSATGVSRLPLSGAKQTSKRDSVTSAVDPARVKTAADGSGIAGAVRKWAVDRFCRRFALSAFCVAVFAGYGLLEAANGSNNGLIQAGMACARIAAISGPIPMMFMTRLRL